MDRWLHRNSRSTIIGNSLQLLRRLRPSILVSAILFGTLPQHATGLPEPRLLKDIAGEPATPASSHPAGLRSIDDVVYFAASSAAYGRELWRSDGTAEGTALLKDIVPGAEGSSPTGTVEAGGTIFFATVIPRGLWVTDGTPAGTVLIKDFSSGDLGPRFLTDVNGTLFFTADGGSAGAELWKSDGTPAGTVLVKDIQPGPEASSPSWLLDLGGTLVFSADDGTHGRELWRSDGTAAGTTLITDIRPGSSGSSPRALSAALGRIYFSAWHDTHGLEPWSTDGTTSGTALLKDINPGIASSSPDEFLEVGGTVFFAANDGVTNNELWKSDGTELGTVQVADIRSGSSGSHPSDFAALGNVLLFSASSDSGYELMSSDGTAAGTVLVKDLVPGSGSSQPRDLVNIDGVVYFSAVLPSINRRELWRTDGTAAGTLPLRAGSIGRPTDPEFVTGIDGGILFAADTPWDFGTELWKSDGTGAGTILLRDIQPGLVAGHSSPHPLLAVGNTLYFAANRVVVSSTAISEELWTTDGSSSGTVLLKHFDYSPGGGLRNLQSFTALGNELVFVLRDGTNEQLWRSDGTVSGTTSLLSLSSSLPGFAAISYLVNANGTLFFSGEGDLWKSDGTGGGTVRVATFNIARNLENVGDTIFFAGNAGSFGTELWKSDGTAAGTVLVKNIASNNSSSSPSKLTDVDGTLFFSASEVLIGSELWKSDGTEPGTVLVKDVRPGNNGSALGNFLAVDGLLFFTANDGTTGTELWTSDGTSAGTTLVSDLAPGSGGSSPKDLTNVAGTIFFSADDGISGNELWKSDGTTAGTVLVKDILPGFDGSGPTGLVDVGGVLFFAADDGTSGTELWASDGTTAGTIRVGDIHPGGLGSAPEHLTNANGTLFFSANDGRVGIEPWLQVAGCGDAALSIGEVCDDGNTTDGDGCDSNCLPTGCGNGVVTGGEQCDDGNTLSGDCCSATCDFDTLGTSCGSDGASCTTATCDGAGSCDHAPAPSGTFCRAAASPCDAEDTCDGLNPYCPADEALPDGTACDTGDPECDNSVCGDGVCQAVFEPAGTACSPDQWVCTMDECDGQGVCNHDEIHFGLECRPATDACDVAEYCNGVDKFCPQNAPAPFGTPCGSASDTECDNPDSCNGAWTCLDNQEPQGTACGDPTDSECDHSDSCSAGVCVDNLAAAGSACGSAADTDCTDPDSCDGTGTCLPRHAAASTACGDPGDTECTDPDSCDGSGTCMPRHAADGNACGDPGDTECDNPDTCDSGSCLANPEVAGAACAPDGLPCTLEQCDGSGACTHPAGHAGTQCRAANGECDVAEQCDGVNTDCPADGFATQGTPCGSTDDTDCSDPDSCSDDGTCLLNDTPVGTGCDDADACTQIDQCASGVCIGGSPLDCDDGTFCTVDSCDAAEGCRNDGDPVSNCKIAEKSLLLLRQNSNPDRDKLLWKWQRGEMTDIGELGDPTLSTNYGLCVYDATSTLISHLALPADATLWRAPGGRLLKYKDSTLSNDGAQMGLIKPGPTGRAKAQVRGKGADLDDPPLGLLALPLTVQLRNDDTATCFQSSFDLGDVLRNDAEIFKAKAAP